MRKVREHGVAGGLKEQHLARNSRLVVGVLVLVLVLVLRLVVLVLLGKERKRIAALGRRRRRWLLVREVRTANGGKHRGRCREKVLRQLVGVEEEEGLLWLELLLVLRLLLLEGEDGVVGRE